MKAGGVFFSLSLVSFDITFLGELPLPKISLRITHLEMRWDLWFGRIIFLHWYYYLGGLLFRFCLGMTMFYSTFIKAVVVAQMMLLSIFRAGGNFGMHNLLRCVFSTDFLRHTDLSFYDGSKMVN